MARNLDPGHTASPILTVALIFTALPTQPGGVALGSKASARTRANLVLKLSSLASATARQNGFLVRRLNSMLTVLRSAGG